MATAQRCVTVTRGTDRAGNDPLSFGETFHRRSEFLDDADGLMTNRQSLRHGILALQDMHIGPTDRGGGYADKRIQRTNVGDRLFIEYDAACFHENRSFHFRHDIFPETLAFT